MGAIDAGAFESQHHLAGTGVIQIWAERQYGEEFTSPLMAGRKLAAVDGGFATHLGGSWSDPRNPDLVLVAAMGHSRGRNEERGVLRSTGRRDEWKHVLQRQCHGPAMSLF